MEKIELLPTYEYTLQPGEKDWGVKIRDHVRPIYFTDEIITWIFENVDGKFLQDGKFLYFSNDEDAMAFKLRWL